MHWTATETGVINWPDSRKPHVTNWPGDRHVGIYVSTDNWRTCYILPSKSTLHF